MSKFIKDLISNFKKGDFKDFAAYVYTTLENKISSSKQQSIKNKYIKIRQSVLQYIIANEKAITLELRKKNTK